MWACLFTGIQQLVSTRVQHKGVFKNLHFEERFWKDAFSVGYNFNPMV